MGKRSVNRRRLLAGMAAAGVASALPVSEAIAAAQGKAVTNGRDRRSPWSSRCFNKTAGDRWDLERTCRVASDLGCLSVEVVPPEPWKVLQKHNLVCAIAPNGMPGLLSSAASTIRRAITVLSSASYVQDDRRGAEANVPNIIAFTGYKYRDADDPKSGEISRSDGADNCVRGLRPVIEHAVKRRVTVCIEHLNTRDSTHAMKGHPGYHGDDLDWVASIIRRVNSPRCKLLFDIYHVQIMHGDIIRRDRAMLRHHRPRPHRRRIGGVGRAR